MEEGEVVLDIRCCGLTPKALAVRKDAETIMVVSFILDTRMGMMSFIKTV